MDLTEDRLRAALLETAEEIPPGAVPPLGLPAPDVRRTRRWLPALAAAAAVSLIISLSVTLAGTARPVPPPRNPGPLARRAAASVLAQFPRYYVALQQSPGCSTCASGGSGDYTNPDRAVVRSTRTGSTLATISVPEPYATFAFVQGAADDRTFVLGAQRLSSFSPPATKLYLLRLDPSAPAGQRAALSALPVPVLPGQSGYELCWVALSPDGHLLATIATRAATNTSTRLRVFNLVTGESRSWLLPKWAGQLDTYQDVTGPPTWDTDSRRLAFYDRAAAGPAELVLLDTSAPAASFSADSTTVLLPRPPSAEEITFGPDAPLLTPDGQHIIESLVSHAQTAKPPGGPLTAFALDTVNVRTGTVTTMRQHSPMFFVLASDPSGSAVIVAIANLPPHAERILAWTATGTAQVAVPADTIAIAW
jgi:hypothetical protein